MKNWKFHLGDQLRNDSVACGKSIEGEIRLEQHPEAQIPKCLLQNACVWTLGPGWVGVRGPVQAAPQRINPLPDLSSFPHQYHRDRQKTYVKPREIPLKSDSSLRRIHYILCELIAPSVSSGRTMYDSQSFSLWFTPLVLYDSQSFSL